MQFFAQKRNPAFTLRAVDYQLCFNFSASSGSVKDFIMGPGLPTSELITVKWVASGAGHKFCAKSLTSTVPQAPNAVWYGICRLTDAIHSAAPGS